MVCTQSWRYRCSHGVDARRFTVWILAHAQGHLFKTAFVKNVPLFLKNIGENVLLCFAASAIEATSKRALKAMDLQWQQTLTGRIHKHYFQNMVGLSSLFHIVIGFQAL